MRTNTLLSLLLAGLLVASAGCSAFGGGTSATPTVTPTEKATPTETPTATEAPTPTETATPTATESPKPAWVEEFSKLMARSATQETDVSYVDESLVKVNVSIDIEAEYGHNAFPAPEVAAKAIGYLDYVDTDIQLTYLWEGEPALRTTIDSETATQFHQLELTNDEFRQRLNDSLERLPAHPDTETASMVTLVSEESAHDMSKVVPAEKELFEKRLRDRLEHFGLEENIIDVSLREEPIDYVTEDSAAQFEKPFVVKARVPRDGGEILSEYEDDISKFQKPTEFSIIINSTRAEWAFIKGGNPYGEAYEPNEAVKLMLYDEEGTLYQDFIFPKQYALNYYNGEWTMYDYYSFTVRDPELVHKYNQTSN